MNIIDLSKLKFDYFCDVEKLIIDKEGRLIDGYYFIFECDMCKIYKHDDKYDKCSPNRYYSHCKDCRSKMSDELILKKYLLDKPNKFDVLK